MARMNELFSLAEKCESLGICVVLILIEEAHASNTWPIGFSDRPTHANFEDRLQRAREFREKFNPPFPIVVDKFNNQLETTYHSWPDRFVLAINDIIVEEACYNKFSEAKINKCPTKVLKECIEFKENSTVRLCSLFRQ